jgi:tRNA threonylcarbamoyladenosine biosynthesis protein TsaE
VQVHCKTEEDLILAAKEVLHFSEGLNVWLLNGEMGAGKTTFTKALGHVLSTVDNVSSPTFSIVNEYKNQFGQIWFHFDFYRIKGSEEAIEMGVYDYLDSGNLCLIEWPSKIDELIDMPHLEIKITVNPDQSRTLSLTKHV